MGPHWPRRHRAEDGRSRETVGLPRRCYHSRRSNRSSAARAWLSHRHSAAHRAIRRSAYAMEQRSPTHDRPRLLQKAGDGRHRHSGGRGVRLGHRKPGQGRVDSWPKSRAARPYVENLAVGKSQSAGQSRRAAPACMRQDRPVVQPQEHRQPCLCRRERPRSTASSSAPLAAAIHQAKARFAQRRVAAPVITANHRSAPTR